MAIVVYSARALKYFHRLADFVLETEPAAALETAALIGEAVTMLRNHPLIGRPVEHDLRELIISRGRTGYVTLYSFEEQDDAVLILALRHQWEAGY